MALNADQIAALGGFVQATLLPEVSQLMSVDPRYAPPLPPSEESFDVLFDYDWEEKDNNVVPFPTTPSPPEGTVVIQTEYLKQLEQEVLKAQAEVAYVKQWATQAQQEYQKLQQENATLQQIVDKSLGE